MDYLSHCKSEISDVCNTVEGHCLKSIKIVHHHANSRSDWLISGHQSVNPSREALFMLSGKYKTFTYVHPEYDRSQLLFKMLTGKDTV